MTARILTGDCRHELRKLPAKSVHSVVTSPPYWGLRDYKIPPSVWGGDPKCEHVWREVLTPSANGSTKPMQGDTWNGASATRNSRTTGFCCHCSAWRGCLGLEPTYQLYVEHIVEIFREVWRVLRPDGTLWLNLGDCYANSRAGWSAQRYMDEERDDRTFRDKPFNTFQPQGSFRRQPGGTSPTNNGFREIDWGYRSRALEGADSKGRKTPSRADGSGGGAYYGPDEQPNRMPQPGLKQKDKAGIPWRVAFALQDDGWYLRQEIIWHKKNPMPESTYDRPTTAHEYLFLFSKSGRTLCWRHGETGAWTWDKPEPEYRWRHRVTRAVTTKDMTGSKSWFRFNLWRGFDYYYDFAAIMEPTSPDSHARAARSRSKEHKHSNGSDLSGKPHGIAIGSPVAGRLVGIGHNGRPSKAVPNDAAGRRALPAEWKQGGPNSRFHKDQTPRGRKLGAHDTDGPRIKNNDSFDAALIVHPEQMPLRNKRSVWSIATKPFKEAHFATFPPALVEPCILAGCRKGGVVLDPFGGAGTVALVADRHGRNAILIEISKSYAKMAKARIARAHLGPEEKRRHAIKQSGKLKTAKGLPLFAAKRDGRVRTT